MPEIDEQKVARYAELLRGIQQRHQLDGAVDLATILRFPDVLASEPDQEHAGTPAEVQKLAGEAIDALTTHARGGGHEAGGASRGAYHDGRGRARADRRSARPSGSWRSASG